MSKFWKKVLSLSLVAFMVLSVVPQPVAAAQDSEGELVGTIEPPESVISITGGTHHMQGFTTDGNSMYWSFTDRLIKTDMSGQNKTEITFDDKYHLGDLAFYNGKIFGSMLTGTNSNWSACEVVVYDATTLEELARLSLDYVSELLPHLGNMKLNPDGIEGVDGVAIGKDSEGNLKLMVGAGITQGEAYKNQVILQYSLPTEVGEEYSVTYEKSYYIPTGNLLYGIQNLAYDATDNSYWLACYGDSGTNYESKDCLFRVSLKDDGTGAILGAWDNYTACGFEALGNDKYLSSRNGTSDAGETGEAVPAQYDEFEGVTYYDAARPAKTGIKGDANGDADLSVKDLVRVISEVNASDKKASTDVFNRWAQTKVEDTDVDYVCDLLLDGTDSSKFPTADQKVTKGTVMEMGIGRNSGDTITYTSDDSSVARVDKNGKVTVAGAGQTTITLSYTPAGSETAETKTCKVIVEGRNELRDETNAVVESAQSAIAQETALGRTVTEFVGNEYYSGVETGLDYAAAKAQYLADGSNRYLIARMYIPGECGWEDAMFGGPRMVDAYTTPAQMVTSDGWMNYIFDMKTMYENDSVTSFNTALKAINTPTDSKDGQYVVYLSSIGFADGTRVTDTSNGMNGVKIVTTASDAAISDHALLEELNDKDFISEVTATNTTWPTCRLPMEWEDIKANYDTTTGIGRYMKVRIYMPANMTWNNICCGSPGSGGIRIMSQTATSGGTWVDYVFDIAGNYDLDLWQMIGTPGGASQNEDGNVIFYVSDVQFSNTVEDFAYYNANGGHTPNNGELLTTESAGYAELADAVKAEINAKGSVAKVSKGNDDWFMAELPLDYYALKTAYETSGYTANRYLVVRAYTSNADGFTLYWGHSYYYNYAVSSRTLVNNKWVNLVIDLDKLYRSDITDFVSTFNITESGNQNDYDLYISELYLADENPLITAADTIHNYTDPAQGELLTSSDVEAIQTEIDAKGNVIKFKGTTGYDGGAYNAGLAKMPLSYYALRATYESTGANRYLVVRAYTTNAGEVPLAWGWVDPRPQNADTFATSSNTLKNGEWVDVVFDLAAIYGNTEDYPDSNTNYSSIISPMSDYTLETSTTEYDLYISDFYLTDTNPLSE